MDRRDTRFSASDKGCLEIKIRRCEPKDGTCEPTWGRRRQVSSAVLRDCPERKVEGAEARSRNCAEEGWRSTRGGDPSRVRPSHVCRRAGDGRISGHAVRNSFPWERVAGGGSAAGGVHTQDGGGGAGRRPQSPALALGIIRRGERHG